MVMIDYYISLFCFLRKLIDSILTGDRVRDKSGDLQLSNQETLVVNKVSVIYTLLFNV